MLLLLIGNGMQGTLLGIRGAIEGYDATTMSLVMSAYSVGFLAGSLPRAADDPPGRARAGVRRARVADRGLVHPLRGGADGVGLDRLRFVVGFCFAGVYVVAESWLNNAATNETRGQALSLYMIVQVGGIMAAQGILNLATRRATRSSSSSRCWCRCRSPRSC